MDFRYNVLYQICLSSGQILRFPGPVTKLGMLKVQPTTIMRTFFDNLHVNSITALQENDVINQKALVIVNESVCAARERGSAVTHVYTESEQN